MVTVMAMPMLAMVIKRINVLRLQDRDPGPFLNDQEGRARHEDGQDEQTRQEGAAGLIFIYQVRGSYVCSIIVASSGRFVLRNNHNLFTNARRR